MIPHRHNDTYGVRVDIWGRRPLVLARVAIGKRDANYLLSIGRVVLSWGPAGGVEEGRASARPHRRRPGRIWWTPEGDRALALDLD